MKSIIITISLLLYSSLFAEIKNLECIGSNSSKWNNCRGAIVKGLSAYVGEFGEGLPNGHGTYTYSDGSVYVGDFKSGKEHGTGIFRCWNHGSKYIGEFRNGKKHGTGTYTYPDGVIYVGEWNEGKRSGNGVLTYTDGKKLVGEFRNDKYLIK